jgi:hypothetical protein
VKVIRRSDVEASGPRREDQVEVFVRFVRAPSGAWVVEADAPPLRAEAATFGEARRLMATQLASRMGTASLESATLIVDLPEDEDCCEPDEYAGEGDVDGDGDVDADAEGDDEG